MAAKKKRVRTRDVVAEGLYIASAATRLSLKNTILVHILAEGEDFDPDRYLDEARAALLTLAEEAEDATTVTRRTVPSESITPLPSPPAPPNPSTVVISPTS